MPSKILVKLGPMLHAPSLPLASIALTRQWYALLASTSVGVNDVAIVGSLQHHLDPEGKSSPELTSTSYFAAPSTGPS